MTTAASSVNTASSVVATNDASTVTQLSSKTMGKEDFLKLLMAEISNQNPLEPLDNKDMILQLSQFSALEGTQALNKNMESYISLSGFTSAATMIGKEVTYLDSKLGIPVVGTVQKISLADGSTDLIVDGKAISMSQVTSIANPTTTTTK